MGRRMIEMDEELLTTGEVAELLRCSRRSVTNYRNGGQLVAYRVGPRRIIFKKADVMAFMQRYVIAANGKQEDS